MLNPATGWNRHNDARSVTSFPGDISIFQSGLQNAWVGLQIGWVAVFGEGWQRMVAMTEQKAESSRLFFLIESFAPIHNRTKESHQATADSSLSPFEEWKKMTLRSAKNSRFGHTDSGQIVNNNLISNRSCLPDDSRLLNHLVIFTQRRSIQCVSQTRRFACLRRVLRHVANVQIYTACRSILRLILILSITSITVRTKLQFRVGPAPP